MEVSDHIDLEEEDRVDHSNPRVEDVAFEEEGHRRVDSLEKEGDTDFEGDRFVEVCRRSPHRRIHIVVDREGMLLPADLDLPSIRHMDPVEGQGLHPVVQDTSGMAQDEPY